MQSPDKPLHKWPIDYIYKPISSVGKISKVFWFTAKTSASWPEGNYFLMFTSPQESAEQINQHLQMEETLSWNEGEKRKKNQGKEIELWSWDRDNHSTSSLGANSTCAKESTSKDIIHDIISHFSFLTVETDTYNALTVLFNYECLLSWRRHCRNAWEAGDGIREAACLLCLWLLLNPWSNHNPLRLNYIPAWPKLQHR